MSWSSNVILQNDNAEPAIYQLMYHLTHTYTIYHLTHTASLCWLEKYYFINYSICLLEYNRKFLNCQTFSTASRKHTMEYLCLLIWVGDKTCCFTPFWNGSPMLTIPTAYICCVCCLNIVDYYFPSDSQHDRFNSHRHQLLVMLSYKAEQTLLKVLSLLPVLVIRAAQFCFNCYTPVRLGDIET